MEYIKLNTLLEIVYYFLMRAFVAKKVVIIKRSHSSFSFYDIFCIILITLTAQLFNNCLEGLLSNTYLKAFCVL